jgi:Ca2+-binding EF-hand superfamily protein
VVSDTSGIELEEDSLQETMAALGFEIPAEILMLAVQKSDQDDSGTMEYDEFVAVLAALKAQDAFVSVSEDAALLLADAQVTDHKLKAHAAAAAKRENQRQELLAKEKDKQNLKNEQKAKMKAQLDRLKHVNSKLSAGVPTREETRDLRIKTEFNKYDTDGGGTIDTSELEHAVTNLGIAFTSERLAEIVKSVDADNSGTIDLGEFRDLLKVLKKDILREAPVKVISTGERVADKLKHDHAVNKVLMKLKASNPADRIRRFMLKYTKGGKQYAVRVTVEEQGQMRAERMRRLNEDSERDAKVAAAAKAAASSQRRGHDDRVGKMQAKEAEKRQRAKAAKSVGILLDST